MFHESTVGKLQIYILFPLQWFLYSESNDLGGPHHKFAEDRQGVLPSHCEGPFFDDEAVSSLKLDIHHLDLFHFEDISVVTSYLWNF
jgi:SPX domain protein involved in polyphosphate accumulation